MTNINQERLVKIKDKLKIALNPQKCEITDDSAAHKGHAGAASGAGHFTLTIVASAFEGLNHVARHRMIYDALHDLMQHDIHALAIIALAPNEETSAQPSRAGKV